MKKFLIGLAILLGIAGLSIGAFFLYDYEGNKLYDHGTDAYACCVDQSVMFDEHGFPILKPEFYVDDASILSIDKNGIITGKSLGETYVTAKGLSFEFRTKIVVRDHKGTIANCAEPYICDYCEQSVMVPGGHVLTELKCEEDSFCTICGYVAEVHPGHDYSKADCEAPETCVACGATRGDALGHKWENATCVKAAHCNVCGKDGDNPLGHRFVSATCTDDSYCSVCNEPGADKALGHDIVAASCELPKHCTRCSLTEGKALGHKSEKVVCGKDTLCQNCGEVLTPARNHEFVEATCKQARHCKYCNMTEGSPLPHTVVEATCMRGSYCSVCNTKLSNAVGHLYVQAEGRSICAYCGRTNGGYSSNNSYSYSYSNSSSSGSQNKDISSYATDVLAIVNSERAAVGLPALEWDSTLAACADIRAHEIAESFSHTRPNGTSCFTAMSEAGYSYRTAGENIAAGYRTPSEVMNGWMNSTGHRANILKENFGKLGVGVYNDNGYINWVQMFSN